MRRATTNIYKQTWLVIFLMYCLLPLLIYCIHYMHIEDTNNPHWRPYERFQFVVTSEEPQDLIVEIKNLRRKDASDASILGEGIIHLKGFTSREHKTEQIKIQDPERGEKIGSLDFSISLIDVEQATSIITETVYEYETFSPVAKEKWAASNLKVTGMRKTLHTFL